MEAYNHLECEYFYRAAVKESLQERKTASGVSGQADRTCGQVLDRMTEAVNDALAMAPEDLRREYGSDCLRLYMLFMGPGREYGLEEAWDEDTMAGLFRYLGRVWRKWGSDGQVIPAFADREMASGKASGHEGGEAFISAYRQIIDQTRQGRYHAGLTMLMALLKRKDPAGEMVGRQTYLRLLLPYAPCISTALLLQENGSRLRELLEEPYGGPSVSEDAAVRIEIPMQYNGRLYTHIRIRENAAEEEAAAAAVRTLTEGGRDSAGAMSGGANPAVKTGRNVSPGAEMEGITLFKKGQGIYGVGRKWYRIYYIPGRIINICDK